VYILILDAEERKKGTCLNPRAKREIDDKDSARRIVVFPNEEVENIYIYRKKHCDCFDTQVECSTLIAFDDTEVKIDIAKGSVDITIQKNGRIFGTLKDFADLGEKKLMYF